MTILGTLFYLVGIMGILFEIKVIQDPTSTDIFVKNLKIKQKLFNKGDSLNEYFSKEELSFVLWQGGYMLWVFAGLFFTFQWAIFLLFLGISFIPMKNPENRKINAIASLMILLFMNINYFHLQIPLF